MPRGNEKRLTVALDGGTYRQLRQLGVDMDKTHQAMMEDAVKAYIATQPVASSRVAIAGVNK